MNAKDKDGNLTESAKRMRDVYNNKYSNKLILFRETKEKAYERADDHPSNEGLDRNDPKYTHPGTGNVAKSGEYDGTGHAGDVEINMNSSQWTYADGTKSEIQGAIVHEFSKHVYGYNNGEPRAPKGSAAEAEQERDAVRLENQDRAANGRPIRKAWGNIPLSPGELADSKNIKRNPTGEKGLDAPYYKSKSKD